MLPQSRQIINLNFNLSKGSVIQLSRDTQVAVASSLVDLHFKILSIDLQVLPFSQLCTKDFIFLSITGCGLQLPG